MLQNEAGYVFLVMNPANKQLAGIFHRIEDAMNGVEMSFDSRLFRSRPVEWVLAGDSELHYKIGCAVLAIIVKHPIQSIAVGMVKL